MYILRTNKTVDDMKMQEEEVSEIFFVPFKEFKKMVENRQPDLLCHDEEADILFDMFGGEFC